MAPNKKVQTIGFGGGDSQIWIAAVQVHHDAAPELPPGRAEGAEK